MSIRVAVLMGGWSSERDVSLVSGAAVADALRQGGYAVEAIDVHRDPKKLLSSLDPRPDVVFNALHGRYGEDGCIQGVLDILGVPYTHSGLLASALAMNKPMAKRLFTLESIVVEDRIVTREELAAGDPMSRPFVIKPLSEGSSFGVQIIRNESGPAIFGATHWPYGPEVMVEPFIPGRELTVAVMGDRALAVTEITTSHVFYDYDAKYQSGQSSHVIPAALDSAVYDEAMALAVRAHDALGCRGVSRADFRYDGETLFMLEVNTQPGMTPTSLVPEQAAYVGLSFEQLVRWMVEHAECDA
ncbi:MAG: D-alanine--D-alanine ligase [Rhodospirillales bacterium]|nr:D-alanine--D-alanine ligase [Rhodospirillales bacterium]